MLNAYPTARPLGFTLVEMLIVIAIIAIASALGMPSYRAFIHNTQIRNAAESIQNGLQKTRAEAVKRNANIEFVLDLGTSTPWKIQLPGNTALCPNYGPTLLECSTTEGAKNVSYAVLPAGATTITFNSLGTVGAPPNQPNNVNGSAPLTQIDVKNPALGNCESDLPAGPARCLRVTVSTGGNLRMCDPKVVSATDPRKC